MSQQTSGYEYFDYLNAKAASTSGGQTPVREPSRFTSALQSINQFLDSATNTIVTVDGVINRQEESAYQPSGQHVAGAPQIPATIKYLAMAGLAVGGSVIAYRSLT